MNEKATHFHVVVIDSVFEPDQERSSGECMSPDYARVGSVESGESISHGLHPGYLPSSGKAGGLPITIIGMGCALNPTPPGPPASVEYVA